MAAIALVQPRARVVGQARGAAREVGDGRHDVGRLAGVGRMPELLRVPRSAQVRAVDPLVRIAPAAVAALDHVDPTRAVAAVGVVVAGPQVAVVVEGQLLRIAQAGGEDLEVGAVELAAQHRTRVRVRVGLALVFDVEAAVADREVEPPVDPQLDAVQVVAEQRDVDAIARLQDLARIGHAVAVVVPQEPQVRDAAVVQVAATRQQPGRDAVGVLVEAVGEDLRGVGHAVAVRVGQETQALVFDRVALVARLALVRAHHLQALLHRARGEIFVEPARVLAHVGHSGVEPEGLGYVHATALVEPEGDRVGEQRLRGPQLDLDALGHAEALKGLASLLRGSVDEGRIVVLAVLLGEG